MVTLKQVREGSVVVVRGDFGAGAPREVTVIEVESDVKNGRPGFIYEESWAYLSQIVRVVKY